MSVTDLNKPQYTQGAHERDSEISCLRFSADSNTLLSRCADDTLKVGCQRSVQFCVYTCTAV